jgi:hypothetical protein
MQTRSVGHETLKSCRWVPGGSDVGCTDQLDPFHTSARVGSPAGDADPTAVQLLVPEHETPQNLPLTAVGWTDHMPLLHDSMRSGPTATHEVVVGQATASSWL